MKREQKFEIQLSKQDEKEIHFSQTEMRTVLGLEQVWFLLTESVLVSLSSKKTRNSDTLKYEHFVS